MLSFAISLTSVFVRYSYYAILFSLVVEIHTCAPRMHSRTPMVCWKSLVLLGTLSISHARPISFRSDKAFGYALGIDVVTEAIRHEKVGYAEDMESGSSDDLCLSFVSTEAYGRERGTCVEENGHVLRSIEG